MGKIHHYAKSGDLQGVKRLIEGGSWRGKTDPDKEDNDGWTALHTASANGRVSVVKYLVEKARVKVDKTHYGDGQTALHCASRCGHVGVVKYLVEKAKAEVHKTDFGGSTALHHASENGHVHVVKYFVEEAKAEVDKTNKYGGTALHYASIRGHVDVVKYLVDEAKAEVDKKRYGDGQTALHRASRQGHVDVVQHLVEIAKAEVDKTDNNGETALDLAFFHKDIRQYLTKVEGWIQSEKLAALRIHNLERPTPASSPACQVFISHTGQDDNSRIFAALLSESLAEEGIDHFYDVNIEAGELWETEIISRAGSCELFICIFSSSYAFRYWCQHELDIALQSHRVILPVYIDGVLPRVDPTTRKRVEQAFRSDHRVEPVVMNRWLDNLSSLRRIQGLFVDPSAKNRELSLKREVIQWVRGKVVSSTANEDKNVQAPLPSKERRPDPP